MATSDDAGVFVNRSHRALVQTVDFFAPIVDDPYAWGRIAAANALSDVYAMGGEPLTALQLVGWPRDRLPFEVLGRVMTGGADVMATAGTTIMGGHSIDNSTPLYGFSVTGVVDPSVMTVNSAARPGDRIVLTKPLGTGIVATAIKLGLAEQKLVDEAVHLMASLNGPATRVMVEMGIRCATDVTGYGLLGHLGEVVEASQVSARLESSSVPVLAGVGELVEKGVYPGGSTRNLDAFGGTVGKGVGETRLKILADAQTSGGLLMAVPAEVLASLVDQLSVVAPVASVIGEFVEASGNPGIEVT